MQLINRGYRTYAKKQNSRTFTKHSHSFGWTLTFLRWSRPPSLILCGSGGLGGCQGLLDESFPGVDMQAIVPLDGAAEAVRMAEAWIWAVPWVKQRGFMG